MANNIVSAKNLGVSFKERILEKVFFELHKGEFVSIVGKSGIGKTTLLNALAGFVEFDGTIKKPEKISYVFQNNSLFPWMTLEENIAFGFKESSEADTTELVQKTGLEGKEKHYPHQLSGGQQQRAAIARAMAANPDLVLLDEPFASLDSYTRLEMQEWINQALQKNKVTTLLVTHDVEEAIMLSDRILLMKNGRIEREFDVPFTRPRKQETRYTREFQELKKEIHASY